MSTKNKKRGIQLDSFLRRRHGLSTVRDRFVLPLRMYRNMLVEKEGTEAMFGEIAGMINVCGLFAQEKANYRWMPLIMNGATAMREIMARHDRVGGRWIALPEEAEHLTKCINIIDEEVLLAMAATDFLRLAKKINEGKKEKK